MNPHMTMSDTPQLTLVLDRGTENPELDSAPKEAVPLTSGESLQGRLDITCRRSFRVYQVRFFLEGISRCWVATALERAERKFLSQTLDVPGSEASAAAGSNEGFRLSIPFHFIVSSRIPSSDSQSPQHCLQLPPSIELGKLYIHNSSGKRFAQPSISYALRAAVQFASEAGAVKPPVESSMPFILSPCTTEFPPTDILDFSAEFKLRDSKSLHRSVFGRNLGTMTITISEPRPLIYDASSLSSSTECHLGLEFLPTGSESIHWGFQEIKFCIQSTIRVKTFYSVEPFSALPSKTHLREDGKSQLRDELVKLQRQEISHVSWCYNQTSSNLVDDRGGEKASHGSSTSSIINMNGTESGAERHIPSQSPSGRWAASITHPIRMEGRLLPTFCYCIAARLYAIILRVKVSGMRKESFYLEVPLQVIHRCSHRISEDEIPMIGPIGEDPVSLGFRRASEASWFSEESLDRSDLPPHYNQ